MKGKNRCAQQSTTEKRNNTTIMRGMQTKTENLPKNQQKREAAGFFEDFQRQHQLAENGITQPDKT